MKEVLVFFVGWAFWSGLVLVLLGSLRWRDLPTRGTWLGLFFFWCVFVGLMN